MGAGILPIAFFKGRIYFLFGREYIQATEPDGSLFKDAGKWSDFGGAKENKETYKETAIREGYEETGGFIGSKKKIKELINNSIHSVTKGGYKSYIVILKYDKDLPKKFRKKFLSIKNNHPELVCKNGLYEKDMIKWFSYQDIKNSPKGMFRYWYYNHIITNILDVF